MSKKILLADDSLTIQKVVELTFMEGDFDVTSVSNGDDALGHLDESPADLVIADIHMPGASGYEICSAVKERTPETPVLLLVGTFEPFEASEMEECGADGHLKKPFDSQELLRLVEEMLEGGGEPVEVEVSEESDEQGFGAVVTEFPTDVTEPVESFDVEIGGDEERFEEEPAEGAFAETTEPESEVQVGMEEQAAQALTDEDVDRIARRVVEMMGEDTVKEIAWDVIPDLAEIVIKDRLKELESQVD